MSDIVTMMQAANPVPDSKAALTDDEFNALLLLTQSRSGNVDVQELTKPVEPEKKSRNRGWLVAAAAFAVVIVALGATLLLGRSATDLEPAAPPTTQAAPPTTVAATPTTVPVVEEETVEAPPTTVAAADDAVSADDQAIIDEYITAFNAADADTIMALMSPSAKVRSFTLFDSPPDVWRSELAWRWALDEQWAIDGCSPSFGAVVCQLTVTGGWADALGAQDAVLRLIITDGVFTSLSLNEDLPVLIPYGFGLADWIAAEHPAELDLMLTAGNEPMAPRLSDESIALWVELLPEWQATLDG